MYNRLKSILFTRTGADNLSRNRGEYRILEIDPLELDNPSSRPRCWGYAFWGPWVARVEPVTKCETQRDVLDFFENFRIMRIDDGMDKKVFPELILGSGEATYYTIADTITVDVDEGRCFIIRDWDRSKRAYRLFRIYSNVELGDWASDGYEASWRMKEFLIPDIT
jgi:hypothetical protein